MLKNQKLALSLNGKVILDTELAFKEVKDGYGCKEYVAIDSDGLSGEYGSTVSHAIANYLSEVAGYGFN